MFIPWEVFHTSPDPSVLVSPERVTWLFLFSFSLHCCLFFYFSINHSASVSLFYGRPVLSVETQQICDAMLFSSNALLHLNRAAILSIALDPFERKRRRRSVFFPLSYHSDATSVLHDTGRVAHLAFIRLLLYTVHRSPPSLPPSRPFIESSISA